MEEKKTELLNKEERLYLSLVYYRLFKDLDLINEKIEKNSPKDYENETNKFKKGIGKGIVNPFLKTISKDLEENKKKILDRISLFENTFGTNVIKEEDFDNEVNDFFKDDKNNEAKTLMAIRLACSKEFEYVDPKGSLRFVSEKFYHDENKLDEISSCLKNNYYYICKKDLKNLEKNMWISLGVVTAASLLFAPLGLASILSLDFVLASATAGAIGAMELKTNEELKKQFREISSDDLAMKFAIKATIIEQIKKDNVDIKGYLDDALTVLGDYRADSEYMMIVENNDRENAKKKISICNNLSLRLAEISGN